jgi:sugar lactone lactonase YvrE
LDTGLNHPSGIALSPDGLWLAVAENKTHWGYSYRVRADGTVEDKQQFYWFHVPDEADDSGAGAWSMDREGRLYAATRMGVQVFDRDGRVRAILPVPGGEVTSISFGGPDFDTLYVTCVDRKVYKRILKVPGVPDWAAPIELPS